MCRFQGSFSKTKPCGTAETTPRCSMRCCWTEPAFPGRTATSSRTARSGCTSPWSRHRQSSTAAARAPRESSGNWIQRFDRSAQAGPGQARPHHAELPGGRKTHSAERGWCKTVRLKVENKGFFALQVAQITEKYLFP